jgi:hypothetical protein
MFRSILIRTSIGVLKTVVSRFRTRVSEVILSAWVDSSINPAGTLKMTLSSPASKKINNAKGSEKRRQIVAAPLTKEASLLKSPSANAEAANLVDAMFIPKSANIRKEGIATNNDSTPYPSAPSIRMTRGVVMKDTATGRTWPMKVQKLPFAILVDMLATDETWGVVMDESAMDSSVTIEVYF